MLFCVLFFFLLSLFSFLVSLFNALACLVRPRPMTLARGRARVLPWEQMHFIFLAAKSQTTVRLFRCVLRGVFSCCVADLRGDFWVFNTTTKLWTWLSGNSTVNSIGHRSHPGVEVSCSCFCACTCVMCLLTFCCFVFFMQNSLNYPSSRAYTNMIADSQGLIWLAFGLATDFTSTLFCRTISISRLLYSFLLVRQRLQ